MSVWEAILLGAIHFTLVGVVVWMAMSGPLTKHIKKVEANKKDLDNSNLANL